MATAKPRQTIAKFQPRPIGKTLASPRVHESSSAANSNPAKIKKRVSAVVTHFEIFGNQ
ncbi:MAG TPA: hypothetical protein VK430_10615 [Xanthobacteraceae bacterium]|nr:hypothetical protein [Xanthobacteraceae bacterium]